MSESFHPGSYDEFAYFHENIEEFGLDVEVPIVSRFFVAVDGLRQISGLRWGDGSAQYAFVHGGAQNAHTFDTVALAMQRPLLALDLPGHGHSDSSPLAHSAVESHGHDLVVALRQLLTQPVHLVGMSLGGLCAIVAAQEEPDEFLSLTLIDITPGVNADKARHITDFVNGPAVFESFDEILARTVAHNPTRSVASLRRGIAHNAEQRPDGTWVWRHQRSTPSRLEAPAIDLWERLGEIELPVTLLRATGPGSVVDDDDEEEFRRRQPTGRVLKVEGSGHSIQGDRPVELAEILLALRPPRPE